MQRLIELPDLLQLDAASTRGCPSRPVGGVSAGPGFWLAVGPLVPSPPLPQPPAPSKSTTAAARQPAFAGAIDPAPLNRMPTGLQGGEAAGADGVSRP
jgi:hypothetical protein